MNTEIQTAPPNGDTKIAERVMIMGDLSQLTAQERVNYYGAVCRSLGLNPLTRPFDYIQLNGKLTLYAKKDATEQLRSLNVVSIDDVDVTETDLAYIVKVKGHDKTGRTDADIGVVLKKDMSGNIANAMMKAVTKAKRRFTLSICGLGFLDETELETIPSAVQVSVTDDGDISPENINQETGEITDPIELVDPMGDWAVSYAASEWNIDKGEAAQQIAKKKLGKQIDKKEFMQIVSQ